MLRGPGIIRLLSKQKSIRFSSDLRGEFVSLLPKKNVTSPFADPQRTRASTYVNEKTLGTNESTVNTIVSETEKDVPLFAENSVNERQNPVSSFIPQVGSENPPPVVEKPVAHVEPKPLSAVDELSSLKESLQKMDKAISSDDQQSSSNDGFDQQAEAEKRRKRMEKNTRIGGLVLLGSAVVGAVSFAIYYGRAQRDDAGNVIPDKHTGSLLAPFYRIYDSIWQWRDYVVEPARDVLLPDPLPAPYLQPKYTVVIEMKNVLVNPQWTYKTGYRFAKRTALDYFLDVIGYPNFEVVIYTSESAMTAMPVLDSIDPNQRIMFRLFRDCTKYSHGVHMKDLSKMNRDLSKVIYIDFDAKAGGLNPENMLLVPEWKGNADDTSLVDLAELLKTIHLSDVDDVRPTIQYYSQFADPAKEFRRRATYLAEQEAHKAADVGQDQSMLKRYSGKLFGFRRHQSV